MSGHPRSSEKLSALLRHKMAKYYQKYKQKAHSSITESHSVLLQGALMPPGIGRWSTMMTMTGTLHRKVLSEVRLCYLQLDARGRAIMTGILHCSRAFCIMALLDQFVSAWQSRHDRHLVF